MNHTDLSQALEKATTAMNTAADSVQDLLRAATAVLLPAQAPRREIICAVALVGGNACHRPPGHPGPCCSTRHTTDSPVYEPLQDGPSMPTNPANGMPFTEDERADAILQRRSPAMSPAAWAAHRKAIGAPSGPQGSPPEESDLESRLAHQRETIVNLQNEVSSQAAQLKLTGNCAQDRQQKIWDLEAEMRRDKQTIARLTESEKAATAEAAALAATVERMERAHYEATKRAKPTDTAPPAPEEPIAGRPPLEGRSIAIAALERIAGMAQPDRIGLDLCETALKRMRGPDSCTREDLAWGLHALHALACLGNGSRWGNSHVNELAQDTIRRIRETNPEAVPCHLELPIAAGYARPNDRGPSPEPPAPEAPATEPGPVPMTKSEMEMHLESAWGLIANAYGGDWNSASQPWRDAAESWRHLVLRRLPGWSATGKEE